MLRSEYDEDTEREHSGAGKLKVNLNFRDAGKCLPCPTKVCIEQDGKEVLYNM